MKILRSIFSSLTHKPITLRFPKRAPLPEKYRGPVRIDTSKCIGCGICVYVCAGSAIKLNAQGGGYEWAYDQGSCTFCEQCVHFCPVSALAMEARPAPPCIHRDELRQVHYMMYPMCPECGRLANTISDAVLTRAFGLITGEVRAWASLCDRCRRLHNQETLKLCYGAGSDNNGR